MDLITLRKSCISRDIPIISPETEDLLVKFLMQYKPKVCLEIGSAVGYSSIVIASTIQKWGGFLYSFEISYASYLEGIQNIENFCKGCTAKNLIVYPFDFMKVDLKKFIPHTIDFVFIDGQKSQYYDYLITVDNFLSDKNFVILDDVIKFKSKMSSLYRYLQKKQIVYKSIQTEKDDGIILIENLACSGPY